MKLPLSFLKRKLLNNSIMYIPTKKDLKKIQGNIVDFDENYCSVNDNRKGDNPIKNHTHINAVISFPSYNCTCGCNCDAPIFNLHIESRGNKQFS